MPKVASTRTPYHFSIPSPAYLPRQSQFYGRLSPSTPSPPSKCALGGPLHDFASMPTPDPAVKVEETSPSIHIDGMKEEPLKGLVPPTPPVTLTLRRGSRARRAPIRYIETLSVPDPIRVEVGIAKDAVMSMRRNGQVDSTRRAAGAARGQLRRAQAEIEKLEARVACLERSERRLKLQVAKEKDLVKDIRVEAEESRAVLVRAEEKMGEMEADAAALLGDYNHYRGWWLTENRSLKVVLREVPKGKWDAGLEAIASSSQGRYLAYSANGSN